VTAGQMLADLDGDGDLIATLDACKIGARA